jgi:hypothetical protein
VDGAGCYITQVGGSGGAKGTLGRTRTTLTKPLHDEELSRNGYCTPTCTEEENDFDEGGFRHLGGRDRIAKQCDWGKNVGEPFGSEMERSCPKA